MDYKDFKYDNHLGYTVTYVCRRNLNNQCSPSWENTERMKYNFIAEKSKI